MSKHLTTSLFLLAAASQLGATECGSVLRDPGFDLWCGEELCAWKVERGEIKRVATWHENDPGVELVGPDTAIAQLSPVDSSDGYCRDLPDQTRECRFPHDVCLEFSLLANIDDAAVVDLNVDVFGDGTVDHAQRLPIARWERLEYRIVIRKPFAGVRFQLAKAGAGTAQLANIGARLADNCEGLPVIVPHPVPIGSPCLEDTDCATGFCGAKPGPAPFSGVTGFLVADKVCRTCAAGSGEHACEVGQVCGLGDPVSPVRTAPTACLPEGQKQLGEQCSGDAYDPRVGRVVTECATGFCTSNVCSTCGYVQGTEAGCSANETCAEAWEGVASPYVCSPNFGVRAQGEPCASHADCASGTCVGEQRRQCSDGRACASPAQCPFDDGLKHGACSTVGIQGGTCQ